MNPWEILQKAGSTEDWVYLFSKFPHDFVYSHYLKSERWIEKRNQRLDLDGHQCVKCRTEDRLNVHHSTYDRVGNETAESDLITLCEWCHAEVHGLKCEATGQRTILGITKSACKSMADEFGSTKKKQSQK